MKFKRNGYRDVISFRASKLDFINFCDLTKENYPLKALLKLASLSEASFNIEAT